MLGALQSAYREPAFLPQDGDALTPNFPSGSSREIAGDYVEK